jgi:pimeloyl-ACP methyl ester carboxylesterase
MPTTPQVSFRTIDGVRIRYADSGSPHGPAVVLTSPWPESVYAFAPMWASLSGHARLFAGHFVWEEEPAQYAAAVLDSVTGNWP